MNFNDATILTIGLIFFILALIIRNKRVQKIEIGKLFSFSNSDKKSNGVIIQLIFFIISFGLIAFCFITTAPEDRSIYFHFLLFGMLLLGLRFFTLISSSFNFLGISLDINQIPNPSFKHFFSGNIFKGGIVFIFLSCALYLFDYNLQKRITEFEKLEVAKIVERTKKKDFKIKYIPKQLKIKSSLINEEQFVNNLTSLDNKNYFIKGRAGIGKSWFLKSIINKTDNLSQKLIFKIDAKELTDYLSIDAYLNKIIFKKTSWFSTPVLNENIKEAIFVIDGLDEQNFTKREATINYIRELKEKFPKSNTIVTSRPLVSKNISDDFEIIIVTPLKMKDVSKISKTRIFEKYEKLNNSDSKFTLINNNSLIDSIETNKINDNWLYDNYQTFLKNNNLNISNSQYFFLRSTFRDLDIVEELFVSYFFNTNSDSNKIPNLKSYGRTKIFEIWIKSKIKENSSRFSQNMGNDYVNIIYDKLVDFLSSLYAENSSVSSFEINHDELDEMYFNTHLKEVFNSTDLFKDSNNKLTFNNHSIDEFFISLLLKEKIKKTPNKTLSLISKYDYYNQTEILPFLVGHYKDASTIFKQIINNTKVLKNTDSFYENDFPIYFTHLMKSKENIKFLKELVKSDLNNKSKIEIKKYLENFE